MDPNVGEQGLSRARRFGTFGIWSLPQGFQSRPLPAALKLPTVPCANWAYDMVSTKARSTGSPRCGEFLTPPSLIHPFTPIWSRNPCLSDRDTTASLVQRIDEGEQKVVRIIIPTAPRKSRNRARSSLRANDDGQRVRLDVKVGDTILFGKYSGQEIKLDGDEYVSMREDEVLAVIKKATSEEKGGKPRPRRAGNLTGDRPIGS